jgi:hypothetical protein
MKTDALTRLDLHLKLWIALEIAIFIKSFF